jgi:hypothetical protein
MPCCLQGKLQVCYSSTACRHLLLYRLTQLQEGEPERDVLRGLLAHETRMAHLHLPWSGLPRDDLSTTYQQLGSLPAIRHLCGMDLPEPKLRDCRTLQRMQQLTMLVIPMRVCLQCLLQFSAKFWCCGLHHKHGKAG